MCGHLSISALAIIQVAIPGTSAGAFSAIVPITRQPTATPAMTVAPNVAVRPTDQPDAASREMQPENQESGDVRST